MMPLARVAATLVLLGSLFPGTPAPAQEVEMGAEVRPRYEVRDPVDGESDGWTSMRVRAGLGLRAESDVRAFVQLQDVRIWGEESGTLSDFRADNLDLHQGYLQAGDDQGRLRWIRAGRQEVALGGERLVGAVGWAQQGRSFDGLRVATAAGALEVDILAFQLSDRSSASAETDAGFAGVHGTWSPSDDRRIDLYGLLRRVRADSDTDEGTMGLRYVAGEGPWSYRLEGSLQRGTRVGDDVSAGMLGVRAGRSFADGRGGVTLWYDRLSGDETPGDGETGAFNTLFATNHKFYGHADLFVDIPAHTGGRGLQDVAVKLTATPREAVRVGLDLHHFRVARSGEGVAARLGEELDLNVTWRYAPNLVAQGGLSCVLAGPGLSDLGRLEEDLTFGYLMLTARF